MSVLVQSHAPILARLNRDTLTLCIATAIGKYLNFIGLSDKMTEEQTYETAQMIIDTHPNLQIDAIKTFLYECKRGAYGYHYNSMDGSKLLMWLDKFVEDYDRRIDEMEYAKHQSTKGELATPLALEDEDGQPIDYEELLASWNGKTKEQYVREKKIAEIRSAVCKKNVHLYDEMPVAKADEIIESAIMEELKNQDLLTF